ncbi:hypothetical protein ABE41_016930 [Fictibacillus arsenicus]|uniref:Uncharacterized protein n=1 Tax=Fictibacillus arsenicus TaxID=255247 RepID=A0A1B1Z8B7_9BACL|nr:DUF6470 family protein [Fictibacillus arsenicus]ANX13695.1 hypothetical protein ABE41_016930 [Fictibacillus arsenicus]
MNFPQIRLETTFGQISITSQKAVQEIKQPPAELSIKQPKAELEIDRTPGQLTIDQSIAREDMDLKNISKRIEEFAQKGYEDWLAGLARMSQEGDDLMRIENGGNPIAEHAKTNSEGPIYEFNIGFIPSPNSVKIDYQPGNVNINWNTNKPEIDVKLNKLTHTYTPGTVSIDLIQRPSLSIDFVGLFIDEKSKG